MWIERGRCGQILRARRACPNLLAVRWERFFEDLEDQLDSEWEAERAALDTEAERLRLSRLTLRERLASAGVAEPVLELSDGSSVAGVVTGVGADWVAVSRGDGALLVPFWALVSVALPHEDLLRTARPVELSRLSERMTFGYALRDLVRRRVPVTVRAGGKELAGTIDRAGADHIDVALHDLDAPRRATAVTGHRIVAFAAMASVAPHPGAGRRGTILD